MTIRAIESIVSAIDRAEETVELTDRQIHTLFCFLNFSRETKHHQLLEIALFEKKKNITFPALSLAKKKFEENFPEQWVVIEREDEEKIESPSPFEIACQTLSPYLIQCKNDRSRQFAANLVNAICRHTFSKEISFDSTYQIEAKTNFLEYHLGKIDADSSRRYIKNFFNDVIVRKDPIQFGDEPIKPHTTAELFTKIKTVVLKSWMDWIDQDPQFHFKTEKAFKKFLTQAVQTSIAEPEEAETIVHALKITPKETSPLWQSRIQQILWDKAIKVMVICNQSNFCILPSLIQSGAIKDPMLTHAPKRDPEQSPSSYHRILDLKNETFQMVNAFIGHSLFRQQKNGDGPLPLYSYKKRVTLKLKSKKVTFSYDTLVLYPAFFKDKQDRRQFEENCIYQKSQFPHPQVESITLDKGQSRTPDKS